MKTIVFMSCLIAVAFGAAFDRSLRVLPAVQHEEVHDEHGQYALRYITAENTVVSERGRLIPTKEGGYVLEIEGQYQYVGDDGRVYVTRYHGGPDGFRVDGDHLPVAAPAPAAPAVV